MIFIFDFSVSRVARGSDDYQQDLDDLRLAFEEALQTVDSENMTRRQTFLLGTM